MRAEVTPELNDLIRNLVSTDGVGVFTHTDVHGVSSISIYGWADYKNSIHTSTAQHGAGHCSWVLPENATAQIVNYRLYRGPERGLKTERGLNISNVSCACGEYKRVTVRLVAPEASILSTGYPLPDRLPPRFNLS